MAITNAQQYKQLLANGGRIGLKGGADAATQSFAESLGGGGQKGKDYAASVGARSDSTFNPGGSDGGGPTFDGAQASTITKAQSDAAKDFKQLQQFKKNLNKPNFTPGFVGSMLTKVFPGNVDYRREFLARNPQLLEYFNSLSEEDQKSNATMNALADIMNIDGTTYEDFLAYEKGSPGLKYSGNVGNLEKFVSSYEMNPDGTFKLSPKGYKIPKTYDYRERPDDGDGGGGMSDYERRLLELEQQLKDQQAAAPTTTQNPFAYRFFADGGSAGGIMNADIVGGMMDGNMDEMGRQMYGLGKLVKKVTRGVKKIVKSPIGKAALLASPFLFKSGAVGSFFGKGSFNPLKALVSSEGFTGLGPSKFAQFLGKYGLADVSKMALTPKGLMAGIGAVSALPFIFQGDEEEDYDPYRGPDIDIDKIRSDPYGAMGGAYSFYADGGKAEPVAKKTMPLIDMDGKEKDYRETGGFVDMGRMERADDVPARLSKNEFVFTADAVRNAGEGDIDKGAEVMYNMMKNLEAGGEVSEESQGLEGARNMFQTSQRLGEVI